MRAGGRVLKNASLYSHSLCNTIHCTHRPQRLHFVSLEYFNVLCATNFTSLVYSVSSRQFPAAEKHKKVLKTLVTN